MLSTKPQSIFKLFLNGIKDYRKIFLMVLPVSAFYTLVQTAGVVVELEKHGWIITNLVKFMLVVVGFLCFLWAVGLVYSRLMGREFSYKATFIRAAKKFLPAFTAPAIWILLSILIILVTPTFLVAFSDYVIIYTGINILFMLLAMVNALVIFAFYLLYTQEVLFKDGDAFAALRFGLHSAFKTRTIFRSLMLLILLGLSAIVFVLPYLGVLFLAKWVKFGQVLDMVILWLFIVWIQIVLFPLKSVIAVHFYNDLALRYKRS